MKESFVYFVGISTFASDNSQRIRLTANAHFETPTTAPMMLSNLPKMEWSKCFLSFFPKTVSVSIMVAKITKNATKGINVLSFPITGSKKSIPKWSSFKPAITAITKDNMCTASVKKPLLYPLYAPYTNGMSSMRSNGLKPEFLLLY